MPSNVYFITGVSGFVGGEFLRTLLTHAIDATCYCLIRDEYQLPAAKRLQQILERSGLSADTHRVFAVTGDITMPQLGLNADDTQNLAQKVTHIMHCAALVKFEKPKAVLEKVNVHGTENIIQFAKKCQQLNPNFQALGYVGTAYVAGQRKGVVRETDFSDAYDFKNNYESTKFVAEGLLHAVKASLPVIIFRPSIILGRKENGAVLRGNVIFPLIQIAKKNPPKLIPFNKNCIMDYVPVDYVASSIYFLLHDRDAIGQVFHLTCGMGKEVSIKQQFQILGRCLHIHLRIIPSWVWPLAKPVLGFTRDGRYFIQGVDPYWAYAVSNPQFSQEFTQSMLNKYPVSCDNAANLFQKTLLYIDREFF